jgi:hypothetical protein
MDDDRKPDWAKWRLHPTVELWEATALWLDIDPDKVKHSPHGWMADDHLFEEADEFKRRLGIVKANAGRAFPASRGAPITDSRVSLQAFAVWAAGIEPDGFSLPAELAAIADAARRARAATLTLVPVDIARHRNRIVWSVYEAACILCGVEPHEDFRVFECTYVNPNLRDRDAPMFRQLSTMYEMVKGATLVNGVWWEEAPNAGWYGLRKVKPEEIVPFIRARGTPLPSVIDSAFFQTPTVKANEGEQVENAEPSSWVSKVQTQAAILFERYRRVGAQPSKNSIAPDLARWCKENDIRTPTGVHPSAETIKRWALGRRWKSPN